MVRHDGLVTRDCLGFNFIVLTIIINSKKSSKQKFCVESNEEVHKVLQQTSKQKNPLYYFI
jgi:hypothetical protein